MSRAAHCLLLPFLLLVSGPIVATAVVLRPGDLVVVDSSAKTLVRLDPATGEREQFASWWNDNGKHLSFPWGIALDSQGRILLGDMNAHAIFAVDPVSERKVLISGGGIGEGMGLAGVRGIAVDGAGGVYASVSRRVGRNVNHLLFHIDLASGDRRPISANDLGSGPDMAFPSDLAVDADGTLLVNNRGASALYRVDPRSGDRSVVSSSTVGDGPPLGNPLGIALLRNGDAVINDRKHSRVIYVDTKTGDRRIVASSEVGSGAAVKAPFGVVRAPDGNLYVSDLGTWSIYHVNLDNGVRTLIASKEIGSGPKIEMPRNLVLIPGLGEKGEAAPASPVPFAVVVLLAAGGGLLFARSRRRPHPPAGERRAHSESASHRTARRG